MADSTDLLMHRICLSEARTRRNSPHKCQRAYSHALLETAACARLRYMADRIIERWTVQQPDLFGSQLPGGADK